MISRSLMVACVATLFAIPDIAAAAPACTSAQRLAGAEQIPYAYDLPTLGASAAAFQQVPFAPDCLTELNANGLPAVVVAVTDTTTRAFADETRQAFSEVTGEYTDFDNGTTVIHTNVTLGVRDLVPVPVTFSANVYLTYDLSSCQIEKVQAFATIPSEVLGQGVDLTKVLDGLVIH